MLTDDEILLGRVRDEIGSSYERAATLALELFEPPAPDELLMALGLFELHGATLRTLGRWYPDQTCVRDAIFEWELQSFRLKAKGLTIAALS